MNRTETGCGLEPSASTQGPVAGFCEHGNEISGSIKGAKRCVHQNRHSEASFKVPSQFLNSEITRQTRGVADRI
jgi:hypothetical protein